MSAESARAFCVRMMSDDEFRNSLGAAPSADAINQILSKEEYAFSKSEITKVIGEFVGRKLDEDELQEMVCGFYEEEMKTAGSTASCDAVINWLKSLA